MVNIIGDSHTRSFGWLHNLNSYWLGPGRDMNLQHDKIDNIKNRLKNINPHKNDINFLFFGEPNVRYQLDWDHHIFKRLKIFEVEPKVNRDYIDIVINNYVKLVEELHFKTKILTPTTTYSPSIPAMKYFNNKLKEVFGDMVLDIFQHTIDESGNPKLRFRRDNFEHDPIHCNNELVKVFEKEINLTFLPSKKENLNNLTEFGTISMR